MPATEATRHDRDPIHLAQLQPIEDVAIGLLGKIDMEQYKHFYEDRKYYSTRPGDRHEVPAIWGRYPGSWKAYEMKIQLEEIKEILSKPPRVDYPGPHNR